MPQHDLKLLYSSNYDYCAAEQVGDKKVYRKMHLASANEGCTIYMHYMYVGFSCIILLLTYIYFSQNYAVIIHKGLYTCMKKF